MPYHPHYVISQTYAKNDLLLRKARENIRHRLHMIKLYSQLAYLTMGVIGATIAYMRWPTV